MVEKGLVTENVYKNRLQTDKESKETIILTDMLFKEDGLVARSDCVCVCLCQLYNNKNF